MHWHTVDYKRDRGECDRALVNRGWWLAGTPRLMPLCRLLGHRPVVGGVDMGGYGNQPARPSRWAECDRCGIRLAQPVDSDLVVGQPYTGPLPGGLPRDVSGARGGIGGQVILGPSRSGLSVEAKVGNRGSEHTLAAHVRVHPFVALYVHTERHGTWLQRRLNPRGYHSRVVDVSIDNGHLRWRLWAKRDESSRDDPWWMRGSVQLDPRTLLFGPARYSYADVGEPQTVTVRMPHGDDHQVTAQLQRQSYGRRKLPALAKSSWTAKWDAEHGIPTKLNGRGRIYGSAAAVTSAAAENGTWPAVAGAGIAAQMTRDRARHGYRPTEVESAS